MGVVYEFPPAVIARRRARVRALTLQEVSAVDFVKTGGFDRMMELRDKFYRDSRTSYKKPGEDK